ncbi:MAG: hypothetical protein HYU64_12115 [Armatimonadetes bacterium]|nr:hypothetical protein [Armatimonadota bacterium]
MDAGLPQKVATAADLSLIAELGKASKPGAGRELESKIIEDSYSGGPKVLQPIGDAAKKVADYAKPRPGTEGNLPGSSPLWAAVGGGISGFLAAGASLPTGPIGALGGIIGGATGVKAGQLTAAEGTHNLALKLGQHKLEVKIDDAKALSLTSAVITGATGTGLSYLGSRFASDLLVSSAALPPVAGTAITIAGTLLGTYGSLRLAKKVAEKNDPFINALSIGSASGAAVASIASGTVASLIFGPSAFVPAAEWGLIIGGLAGASGTLSGSAKASTRDAAYGGLTFGFLLNLMAGIPAANMVGAISSGIGGKIEASLAPEDGKEKSALRSALERGGFGALTGALISGALGALGGPQAVVPAMLVGAGVGGAGALVGPVIRQVERNLTQDGVVAISKKLDPKLENVHLNKAQKALLGGTVWAMSGGLMGLVFTRMLGPMAPLMVAGAAFAAGAIKTYADQVKRDHAKSDLKKQDALLDQLAPSKPWFYRNLRFGEKFQLLDLIQKSPKEEQDQVFSQLMAVIPQGPRASLEEGLSKLSQKDKDAAKELLLLENLSVKMAQEQYVLRMPIEQMDSAYKQILKNLPEDQRKAVESQVSALPDQQRVQMEAMVVIDALTTNYIQQTWMPQPSESKEQKPTTP